MADDGSVGTRSTESTAAAPDGGGGGRPRRSSSRLPSAESNMALRGDDALLSLMDEMSSRQGYRDGAESISSAGKSGEDDPEASKRNDGVRVRLVPEVDVYGRSINGMQRLCPESGFDGPIWNPYVRSSAGGGASLSSPMLPPTNPAVELHRRRAFEKFKRRFRETFQLVVDNAAAASSAKKGRSMRRDSSNGKGFAEANEMWKDLPVHAIMERWHFARKLEESMGLKKCRDNLQMEKIERRNCADVGFIRSCLVEGRKSGASMDPILIAPSRATYDKRGAKRPPKSSRNSEESPSDPSALTLLRNEIMFQWKREKRRKEGSLGGTYGNKQNELDEELDTFFSSGNFLRWTRKLYNQVNDIAEVIEVNFWNELGRRASQAAMDSSSQQLSHRRKGGKKSKGVPKISFDAAYHNSGSPDNTSSTLVTVTYSGLTLKLNRAHYDKLEILFDRSNPDSPSPSHHRDTFASVLFALLARYDMLEGAGLQSSLTGDVFDVLLRRYGCDAECFASPFNCRYERFCSAFPDTDGPFGSLGSFFDYEFLGNGGGCFQANPPFVADLIEHMVRHMDDLLDLREEEESEGGQLPLMFIVFVPAWTETAGWKALNLSSHLAQHVLLSQKSSPHYYCEGTQHRRRNGRYRIASFDTSVFFLQNEAAKSKWRILEKDIDELKSAFAMNPEDRKRDVKSAAVPKQSKLVQVASLTPWKEHQMAEKSTKVAPARLDKSKKKRQVEKLSTHEKRRTKKKKLVEGEEDQLAVLSSLGILGASEAERKTQQKMLR